VSEDNHRVVFTDVAAQVGLSFVNLSGQDKPQLLVETTATGVAFLDYDADGWLDLFFVNGTLLNADPPAATNRLFRNAPDSGALRHFRETTRQSGLQAGGWGMGCATGDIDNDGDTDLLVTYWGPNLLYRNNGDGTFHETAAQAGVDHPGWGASAAFADLDNDGWLDLYVTNYIHIEIDHPPKDGQPCRYKGLAVPCGPQSVPSQADALYRNNGDGTFADMSTFSGLNLWSHAALGVTFGDFDNDGDLDIYVANDSEPNTLLRNDGDWHFSEIGEPAGVAYSENGRPQAGMGVHNGDYDNDGDLDLFVTNFSEDYNTLYQNQSRPTAPMRFTDASHASGLSAGDRPYLGWATAFWDYDNDGWLDLYVINGHVYPQLAAHPSALTYHQRNLLYQNQQGRFLEVGPLAGAAWTIKAASRAAAQGDYDNDGDLDLAIVNHNATPSLLRNEGGNLNNWLGLELVGKPSNRDGIGARVWIFAADQVQMREVHRGYGFQGQHDPRLLVGLGINKTVDRIEIRWPSGTRQTINTPPLRRYLTVHEGNDALEQGPAIPPPQSAPLNTLSQAAQKNQSATDWAALGNQHYLTDDYGAANTAFSRALVLDKDHTLANLGMGTLLYAGLGQADEALLYLEKAAQQDSSWAASFLILGKVYLDLDRLEQASRAFERVIRLQANDWHAYFWLGRTLAQSDRLTEATNAFINATRRAPWAPEPHLELTKLYTTQGNERAANEANKRFERYQRLWQRVESLKLQIEQEPQNEQTYLDLGLAYMEQGGLDQTTTHFQEMLEKKPQSGIALYGLGLVSLRRNDPQKALDYLKKAAHYVPSDAKIRGALGQAYFQLERYDEAVGQWEQIADTTRIGRMLKQARAKQ
jgi:tetratricopeptide (TPR) repeat protein